MANRQSELFNDAGEGAGRAIGEQITRRREIMIAKRIAPPAPGEFVGTQLDTRTDREQRATARDTSTTPLSETLRGLPNSRDVTSEYLGTIFAVIGPVCPPKPTSPMSAQELAEAKREGETEAEAWRKHRQRQRRPFKNFKA